MPTQNPKAGVLADAYYNSATFASPTWVAIAIARDVTLVDEFGTSDASSRVETLAADVLTLRKIGFSAELLNKPAATEYAALASAYRAGTSTEFLLLDGTVTSGTGAQGPRFMGIITKFQRKEPLEGTLMVEMEVKRTLDTTATTSWYTA